MPLSQIIQKRNVIQQYRNWYVMDEEFPWSLIGLQNAIFKHIDINPKIPVVFCSINDANKIISDLGDEEDEYLRFASGIYWRDLGIIFIFDFDEYLPLIETLFHEFRHVMQDLDPAFRHYFDTDRKLPYRERITEMDAFKFAKEKTNEYLTAI
jgi:hypothetical protein